MADQITLWSDELARDPSSLIFLHLGEALRRQGQLDVALKFALRGLERHAQNVDAHDLVARIAVDRGDLQRAADEWAAALRIAPGHVGAMKGLGFVSYQLGRFADAEQYLSAAAEHGAADDVSAALSIVRRSSGGIRIEAVESDAGMDRASDDRRLFADFLIDEGQTALLLDGQGLVLGGVYPDADGTDVGQEIGAQLSGVSDEVIRATRHLGIGAWRSIVFETQAAVVAMAPAPDGSLLVVAASRATPLGLLRRLLDRCAERAVAWLRERS
jgi:tetratricopeptide (TPR) repeat protein